MLRSMKDMETYSIGATNGVIGQVKDFYFDDDAWVIRYLVVETGAWLSSRRVLISPIAIGRPNWSEKTIPVSISQEQVKNSPNIDTDKPVSRQHEMGYLGYFGYPNYWGGGGLWGAGFYPDMLQAGLGNDGSSSESHATRNQQDDPNLRSGNTIMKYYVHATDGDIGHVQGLIVDEETWAIRYLVVNTSNWWLGHQVLIAPEWIDNVDWLDSKVSVDLTRQAVKDAPEYDSTAALNREQELHVHKHYGRIGYWCREDQHEASVSPVHAGRTAPEVAARRHSH
jgi:sporulation protein YlmC with PRC-barrel domain